jgi:hypothetical protein
MPTIHHIVQKHYFPIASLLLQGLGCYCPVYGQEGDISLPQLHKKNGNGVSFVFIAYHTITFSLLHFFN